MRRAGLLLLCAAAALGQEERPDPLAPPPPAEVALRRETGELLARLARRRTTPAAEEALLEVEVDERGRLFGHARRVEVALRRGERGEDLRLRFREPAELRDRAWLLLADGRAYAYDPARRRAERVAPLEPSWRVGGGLLLRDLRAPDDEGWEHVHVRDDRLLDPDADPDAGDEGQAVRVVRSTPPDGPPREAWLERERHVPLLARDLDAAGQVVRATRLGGWREVQGCLRPFALTIDEPAAGRVTRVTVRARRPPPAGRFDPARFWEE
ncbi:MAG: outer membrane lipoprotein-sorting protein [Planctomycetes bacterium]|nr:outer membrane lipoprotein-sorting protein [Planctomycetota bacterium]